MFTSSLITTVVSVLAGGAVAAIGVVGLVNMQTAAPSQSPTRVDQPVVVDYGSN